MENENRLDAYTPREMAQKAVTIGIAKANLALGPTFALAVLAGAFIALGACFYVNTITGVPASLVGPGRILGGLAFCLGLILVVVGGAELFTGNILILMAVLGRKVTLGRMLRNWAIVYTGNLVGSLMVAGLVYFAWQWKLGEMTVGASSYILAGKKMSMPFATAFCSGVLCNVLVCLAVWLCYSARTTTDKIVSIIFPITAFVALGFEHSVANMYCIPYGMALARTGEFLASPVAADAIHKFPASYFTLPHFLLSNLLPVTLGNIAGGGLLVGAVYWFAYLRGKTETPSAEYVVVREDARVR